MNKPKSSYSFNDNTITNYWIRTKNPEEYKPFEQVYGVVFNKEGKILIARESKGDNWQIPGGKPEKKEKPEETIKRELKEETDITVSEIKPLGVVKVLIEDKTNKQAERKFYQLRYVCLLDKVLPPSPDPERGNIWERKFVKQEEINNYIKWGAVGEAMFKDAIQLYNNSLTNNNSPV